MRTELHPGMPRLVILSFLMLAAFIAAPASAGNYAPVISGTPPAYAYVGKQYYFRPTASDRDGDVLKFSIANKPGWASFDSKTGTLSGTPNDYHEGGVWPQISIKVSDGAALRSLDGFAITVKSASRSTINSAPKISGTPPKSAAVNKSYSFTPTASDPNGDTLKFSIRNKPGWAAFSTSTGRLYGTPSSSSTGSFSDIVISVTDGKVTTALPRFTITVGSQTSAGGRVTLSWQPPTKNTDGTKLTNLAGFHVYYGRQSGKYTERLLLPSPSYTSVAIEGLASGTWYFRVRAKSKNGAVSGFSGEASTYVN